MLRPGDGGRSRLFLRHEQHGRRTRRPAPGRRLPGHHRPPPGAHRARERARTTRPPRSCWSPSGRWRRTSTPRRCIAISRSSSASGSWCTPTSDTAPATYHLATEAHGHLVCEVCGATIEAPEDLFEAMAEGAKRRLGFELRPYHFAVLGVCAECAAIAADA